MGGKGEERGLRMGAERGERKEKETKRQFENKEGLRDTPVLKFSRPDTTM